MSEKKIIRSCDIEAIRYGGNLGMGATITIQRAIPSELWRDTGPGSQTVCNCRKITTRLRMLRCLSLQSAFLAQGGKVLE